MCFACEIFLVGGVKGVDTNYRTYEEKKKKKKKKEKKKYEKKRTSGYFVTSIFNAHDLLR